MTAPYYSLITNAGLVKHADAANNSVNLDLTQMAVGDSNGIYYDPDGTELALVNETHRVNLTHIVIDENNPNQLIIEAVLDEVVGPFYIREVGIFDSNGDLFAIGKYPETFKPNLPTGSGKRLYIRMILGFANAPSVNLVINNDIALDPNFSTDVNNALSERLVKTNNLSDLNDIPTARSNLGLGQASLLNIASNEEAKSKSADDKMITPLNLAELVGVRYKKLLEIPIANVANIDITDLVSDYNAYLFRFEKLKPANDDVSLWIRLSNDNGVSFGQSATYQYSMSRSMDSIYWRDTVGTAMGAINNMGNDPMERTWADFILHDPTGAFGYMHGNGMYAHKDGWQSAFIFSGRNSSIGGNVNAVRFLFSSGNFAPQGVVKVYGLNYD